MCRLALEHFAAAKFADEFAIARRDFAAHGHDMGSAFDFHSFERIVIDMHLVRFGENRPAVI